MARKIDLSKIQPITGSRYPRPYDEPCRSRSALRVGDAACLTQFGVVITTIEPGAWSSQRHWHSHEDEFIHVLDGELVLVTDAGEEIMRVGDCAGFPGGERDGHHLQNRTDKPARILVVGSRLAEDFGEYPDIDMKFLPNRYTGGGGYVRKDGGKI